MSECRQCRENAETTAVIGPEAENRNGSLKTIASCQVLWWGAPKTMVQQRQQSPCLPLPLAAVAVAVAVRDSTLGYGKRPGGQMRGIVSQQATSTAPSVSH